MKRILLITALFSAVLLNAQSPENKSWSIDYLVWNDNGTPALHINCGSDEAFDFQGDFTIELWVRAWNFVENRKLIGKSYADDNVFDNGYIMGFTENQVYTEFFNPNTQQVPITLSGTLPVDSAYVHLASVYSVSQGKLFNYINGNLSGETDMFPPNPVAAELAPLIIGSASWGDFTAFQSYGDIDEVRIWSKELSENDLKSNMHFGLEGNEEDLVAYYNFNNASGDFVPDDGPNGLDGTLTNSDHISTAFSTSSAPVADLTMNGLNEVQAAWYRTEENFHKINSDLGMSVTTNIEENQYWKYLVMGNTGEVGITADNAPENTPLDFNRTSREWYIKCSSGVNGTFTLDLEEADGNLIQDDFLMEQYALLWRPSQDVNFIPIANPTSPLDGIFQFQNFDFSDGFYAFGVSSEAFELQTNISTVEPNNSLTVFPNPSNGILNVSGIQLNDQIQIHNSIGSLVKEAHSNANYIKLDLTDLSKGSYILTITSKNNTQSQRLILQ